ncbi:PQQ-binding-like beta-propeller repeat protein [Streptomyces sp. NPDC058335]|uniref:outer membrane protein assembly factor BamB family protein n=1 Tax=Streptomyces sp. NPDC058335 TaxID=3346451 RepID=UPI00365C33E4
MTQPPPPPPNQPPQGTPEDQPPQGTSGAPQDTPPQDTPPQGAFGAPEEPQDAPPQAGFGAPTPPPAAPQPPAAPAAPPAGPQLSKAPQAGYGYPGQPTPPPAGPPQAPGYGYPQAAQPAQPPQPPTGPGYGYPGQPGQPNAYGQQPAPATVPFGQQAPYGQQPGYGYPGQPGYPTQQAYPGYPGQPTVPMPSQPTGGGRKMNAQVAIIVAAVVAIALIIGGGIWYAGSGDDEGRTDTASTGGTTGGGGDEKGGSGGTGGTTSSGGTEKVPGDPASKVLFQIPSPAVAKDDTVIVSGSWLTEKAYVKSGVAEIVGYDPDKGTKLWTIKLPGPVCTASRKATADGKTAVVFQPKMPAKDSSAGCSEVAAIDLAAGKELWRKTVKSGDYPITFDNVTVGGNTVALGATEGGSAFDITTGKLLWSPKAADTCYDAGYGGGTKLVAVRKCGTYDARELHIQTIDPASGKVLSEYKMATGIEYASIVSTDPLVVAADVGDSAQDGSGVSDFFSIDNKTGKLLAKISAPGEQFAARCDGITEMEQCSGIAVGANRLYLPTEEHDGTGEYSRTNEILAFDLTTGKQTGQRADAGDGYTLFPLRTDGTNVIAYKGAPYDEGGQVVSIDGGTFKQTKLLQNPSTEAVRDAESRMLPEHSEIIYSQGHLYMASEYADDSSSSSGDKEYLALAFGTSG